MNGQILVNSFTPLFAKILYRRAHDAGGNLDPTQVLFMEGVLATISLVFYLNVNLLDVLMEPIKKQQKLNLSFKITNAILKYAAQFFIVKYLSLMYIGLTQNISPVLTVFLSYLFVGERVKLMDLFLLGVTLAGVTLITVGYSDNYYKLKTKDEYNLPTVPPVWSIFVLLSIPFLRASNFILTHKMSSLHENTIVCYQAPFLTVSMFIVM